MEPRWRTPQINQTQLTRNIIFLNMRLIAAVALFLAVSSAHAVPKADLVLVKKGERKLLLISAGEPFREYRISLGPKPRGHKMVAGDERTPEGEYVLDRKNQKSAFYKSIRISYPNDVDLERARRLGVNPGGSIMIHGQPNEKEWPEEVAQTFNWTNGCIAVTDTQMDEIWDAVDEGTPIRIQP